MPHPSARHSRRLALVLVALVALVPRLVYLLQLSSGSPTFLAPEGGDSIFYDRVASIPYAADRAYFHSPLYQWFLSAIYAVAGRDLFLVRVVQHAIGVGTAVLVTLAGARLLGRWRPAVAGGILYGLAGPPTFYEGQLLVDALVPPLVVLTTWSALRELDRPGPRLAFGVGVLVGVSTLARGTFLLWLPVLGWWMWRTSRARAMPWKRPAALCLGAALTIAPVTVRNWMVERDFVLTAANAGLNLYIGNNARAHGAYVLPAGLWFRAGDPTDDFRGLAVATQALGHSPKSSELSRWWTRRAVDYALDNPLRTLDVTLAKARLTFTDYEFPQLYHYYGYRAVAPILRWLPTAGWVLAPALFGFVLLRCRYRASPPAKVALYLWLTLVQVLGFLPFFVVGRYRVGLLVLAAPLAGLAIVGARRRWRLASGRARVAMLAWAIACGLVVFWPPPASFHAAPQYEAFGRACERNADAAGARAWYTRALEERADYEPALHPLARLLFEAGELEQAEAVLLAAIEEGSDASRTYEWLGRIRHARGDLEAARTTLRQAIDAEPGNIRAWRAYAAVLVDLGRFDEARSVLESAAAMESDPERAAALREDAQRVHP